MACGIQACLRHLGRDSLIGAHVAIQGVGNVGTSLAQLLIEAGANVTIADVRHERIEALRARELPGQRIEVVAPDEIVGLYCDVLAPCGLGDVVTDETLETLRCRIIAGGANNVLNQTNHSQALLDRGIVYAPDYCVNAGGLVYLQEKLRGCTDEEARVKVAEVGEMVAEILMDSNRRGIPTTVAAQERAMNRLAAATR